MDIPELSKTLCQAQTNVVQRYVDGVERALPLYGWEIDIVGPSSISPSFTEIVACYRGYPFTLTFSDSGTTIHAQGRTVPGFEASARAIKNLTKKVLKALTSGPYLSTEAAELLAQWREAREDCSSRNRQSFIKLSRDAAEAVGRLQNSHLEHLKLAASSFVQMPHPASEQTLATQVNNLLRR